ncbi:MULTISPECIES: hypothetical protein [Mycobacteriaceae]|uniref:hypothetical protein n=1 Tax=Mycobacteriaceae TaxID=1762 RepID=UPI001E3AE9FD|nr:MULTISPECIES: hypothetical protein [Mycolicibacterium]MCC9185365.1 hypothetical protein [Mycolicibacterium mageritense]
MGSIRHGHQGDHASNIPESPGRQSSSALKLLKTTGKKAADKRLTSQFADRARSRGLQAAWELFIPHLQPLITNLVTEAIPRADAQSAAAAVAIGNDRAVAIVEELRRIDTPTLIIAGDDTRHPTHLARSLADVRPMEFLARATMSDLLVNADDMAHAFASEIEEFLATTSDPETQPHQTQRRSNLK